MSKIARRTLCSSRSRSKRASARAPAGSSASTRGEVVAFGGELGKDRLAASVAEQVVVLVETDGGAEDGIVADQPQEARLDEVVELAVERAGLRRRRGARERRGGARIDQSGYDLRRARAWRGVRRVCRSRGSGSGLVRLLVGLDRLPGQAVGQAVAGSATCRVSASAARRP